MYDLAIIGAGAAGLACAKQAAKSGLKTILFDTSIENFGGTCLNKGCIPAKFFLNSSKTTKIWQQAYLEKNAIVEKIKKSSFDYLQKLGIKIAWGNVYFLDSHTLMAANEKIDAKNIIIATGSSPKKLFTHPNCSFAEDFFLKDNIEENFLIIGAGYIGIEFACLLNNFNKAVTLIEKEGDIIPAFPKSLTNRLRIALEKKGIKIDTSSDAKNYNFDDFDKVLLSVGREPNIKSLDIEKMGLFFDKGGWIKTDKQLRTNLENIYACGDVNGKKLLAYTAEYQAKICIDTIIGKTNEEDYLGVPDCVFALPQIAKVGISEDEAKEKNIKYKLIKSNFFKFSSAYVYNDQDGFIQVIVGQDDRILGAAIISTFAADLISIFSYAVRNNFDVKSLKKCVFIHPTLSEIIPALLSE